MTLLYIHLAISVLTFISLFHNNFFDDISSKSGVVLLTILVTSIPVYNLVMLILSCIGVMEHFPNSPAHKFYSNFEFYFPNEDDHND